MQVIRQAFLMEAGGNMALISVRELAKRWNIKPETFYRQQFRAELGLPVVRIGRHIKFDERDIERVIAARKESLPIMPFTEGEGYDA